MDIIFVQVRDLQILEHLMNPPFSVFFQQQHAKQQKTLVFPCFFSLFRGGSNGATAVGSCGSTKALAPLEVPPDRGDQQQQPVVVPLPAVQQVGPRLKGSGFWPTPGVFFKGQRIEKTGVVNDMVNDYYDMFILVLECFRFW